MFGVVLAAGFVAVVWTCLIAAGAVLVGRGIRGRLIDRTPRCCQCSYDLSGPPLRPPVCPECGSAALRPGAVRLGRRAMEPRLIVAGLAVIVTALTPAAIGIALANRIPAAPLRAAAPVPAPTPVLARPEVTTTRPAPIPSIWIAAHLVDPAASAAAGRARPAGPSMSSIIRGAEDRRPDPYSNSEIGSIVPTFVPASPERIFAMLPLSDPIPIEIEGSSAPFTLTVPMSLPTSGAVGRAIPNRRVR